MSLIACPECGRQISTAAFACPGCGVPMQAAAAPPRRHRDWVVPAIAAGGVLATLLGGHLVWSAAAAHHRATHRPPRVEVVRAVEVREMPAPAPFGDIPMIDGAYEMSAVDQPPSLANAQEVSRMLSRSYPPLLRDAGVTGRVVARFRLSPEGIADPGSIAIEAASHHAFEDAAMRAIERMRFRPARLDGRHVAVWVTIPIAFTLEH